ncbi:MAG: DUF3391 domain-containing protein [Candidatus Marinimicrobia bacterium]|nr:DUF3391 domain-containing protein [Candidatus Neomarinimicrobiota bacterium]
MRPIDRPRKTHIEDLKVGMFVQMPGNWTQHSFVRSNFMIKNAEQISKIAKSGFSEVVVNPLKSHIRPELHKHPNYIPPTKTSRRSEIDLGPPLMPTGFSDFLTDATVAPKRKASHLYEVCLHVMDKVLKDPSVGNITQFKEGVSEIVDLLLSDTETATQLFQLTSRDHYTFTHSINVGVMSILLTKALYGESTPHDMRELSAAYFLHDLGKAKISDELLYSTEKYTESERQLMEAHPMDGYDLLAEAGLQSVESKIILSQHHEREDGSGYPQGLQGEQIHIYSRICATADVFDALTSRRLFKPSLPLYDALVLMKFDKGLHLNKEVFSAFVQLFKYENPKTVFES